ncbi:glycosyltransferase [Amycolatopsis sp. NPDC059021]|uniref:glycosyltransferase n=1 Tax=Amycolatopsis sp. NPDC059021 TaxID=3346704 RepID=UPI00366F3D9F
MRVVFVLLTYAPDAPAGIERSIAALVHGLRATGHPAYVLTAGPPTDRDGTEILRLPHLTLPTPATEDDLLAALDRAPTVADDVRHLLSTVDADVVCWVDATWGLGFLAPHPGIPTALMVRVLRTDTYLHQALAHCPDRVLTNSEFLITKATAAGLDTTGWQAVPNALLAPGSAPGSAAREQLRTRGPVRIVARAEPHKGIAELIDACPHALDRDVDIVLATAGFEYWPGMQHHVVADCRRRAAAHPRVRLVPDLPWRAVQPFLAEAACTVIASTSPETFCNTALEALSVGTPVITFDLGHVPTLIGDAGTVVPTAAGAAGLWHAVNDLLAEPSGYHRASRKATGRASAHNPNLIAHRFLDALAPAMARSSR